MPIWTLQWPLINTAIPNPPNPPTSSSVKLRTLPLAASDHPIHTLTFKSVGEPDYKLPYTFIHLYCNEATFIFQRLCLIKLVVFLLQVLEYNDLLHFPFLRLNRPPRLGH